MIAYLSPFILSSLLQRYYIIRWQIVVVVGAVRVHARQKITYFFAMTYQFTHARNQIEHILISQGRLITSS